MNCRVVRPFRSDYSDPLYLRVGERVVLGGHDDQWQGWIWCWVASNAESISETGAITSKGGSSKGGWVPERILHVDGESATLLEDYDATELDVVVGEVLTILAEESGWVWCQNQHGKKGWLPREHVDCSAGAGL